MGYSTTTGTTLKLDLRVKNATDYVHRLLCTGYKSAPMMRTKVLLFYCLLLGTSYIQLCRRILEKPPRYCESNSSPHGLRHSNGRRKASSPSSPASPPPPPPSASIPPPQSYQPPSHGLRGRLQNKQILGAPSNYDFPGQGCVSPIPDPVQTQCCSSPV